MQKYIEATSGTTADFFASLDADLVGIGNLDGNASRAILKKAKSQLGA